MTSASTRTFARWPVLAGAALTASGIAHVVRPRAFEPVNRLAFGDHIRAHVLVNGSIEAGLGLALLDPRLRRPAAVALVVYLTYFNANVVWRQLRIRGRPMPPST